MCGCLVRTFPPHVHPLKQNAFWLAQIRAHYRARPECLRYHRETVRRELMQYALSPREVRKIRREMAREARLPMADLQVEEPE